MEIKYTSHVLDKCSERKIEKVWIEETIKKPDRVKNEGYKWYAVKKLNGKTLKVVYIKQNYIKIITVFWVEQ